MVIYPEQFGESSDIMTMAETLSTDIVSAPSPLWLRLRAVYKGGKQLGRKIAHREHKSGMDF